MATLTITGTHDYRLDALSNITNINFSTTAFSIASFASTQFDNVAISTSVTISGDTNGPANPSTIDVFMPSGGTFTAAGWSFVNWTAQDSVSIFGSTGAETITGSSQADLIIGGLGADTLDGGNGNDAFYYFSGAQVVAGESVNGGIGTDTLVLELNGNIDFTVATLTSIEKLDFFLDNATATFADAQFDPITAVDGGPDTDALIINVLDGSFDLSGATFTNWTAGTDTITINGTAGISNILTGSGQNDTLFGSSLSDAILGGGGDDTIIGGAGGDSLDGQSGVNTLSYAGSSAGVTVNLGTHAASGGDAAGDTFGNFQNLTGSNQTDMLTGDGFANTLDGGAGADTLVGGVGNDIYIVDNASDIVTEAMSAGIDEIRTGLASYSLAAIANVENLTGTSSSGQSLTGNGLANTITGNSGSDTLNGGGGVDIMSGLGGNDKYYVDNANDAVSEAVGGGSDRVLTSVSYTLTGGSEIELFTTINNVGTDPINLFGNALDQTIQGNAGTNVLKGGGGTNTLNGLGGNDGYIVDSAGDIVNEAVGGGSDQVKTVVSYTLKAGQEIELFTTFDSTGSTAINLTGNELAQTIIGNAGTNTLNGGGGVDTMSGLGGNDTYYVDSADDVVVEGLGDGINDRVFTTVSYTLAAGTDVEVLATAASSGTTAINLTGNGIANTVLGNAGDNVINGGGGNDTLKGLGGNDTYYVDSAGDVVVEAVGAGTNDRVFTSVSYTLAAGVDVEVLATAASGGTAAINLTGNAIANTVLGNAGDNVINGGGGSDTLKGLAGHDTFLFNTALNAATNLDSIGDFDIAQDHIKLAKTVFAALTGSAGDTLLDTEFYAGAAAHDADDRIIYNSATGAVFYDSDGTGAAAAVQFATLTTHPVLDHTHFLLG